MQISWASYSLLLEWPFSQSYFTEFACVIQWNRFISDGPRESFQFFPSLKRLCLVALHSQSVHSQYCYSLDICIILLPTFKFLFSFIFPNSVIIFHPISSPVSSCLFGDNGRHDRCELKCSGSIVIKGALEPSHRHASFLNFLCALASSTVITHLALQ